MLGIQRRKVTGVCPGESLELEFNTKSPTESVFEMLTTTENYYGTTSEAHITCPCASSIPAVEVEDDGDKARRTSNELTETCWGILEE